MSEKKKPLVLVVDDEPRQAEKIANIVRSSEKYEPIIAHNGYEAMKVVDENKRWLGLASNNIKCILLDIQMPEMDGLRFLKFLRKAEIRTAFARFIPVVMLTAYEDEDKWASATNPTLGIVAGYLKKPIDKNELLDILTKIIDNKETDIMIDITRERGYERRRSLDK